MTLMDVTHDFAVVSILLAIGYFLRMKVKLFQCLFLYHRRPGRSHHRTSDPGTILPSVCDLYRQHQRVVRCTAGRYLCLLIFGRVNGKNI